MKVILLVLSVVSFSAVQADSKWGQSLLYEDAGKGSLLIQGDPAERLYHALDVKAVKVQGDIDFTALRKTGKNISCYERLDSHQVQCVISFADLKVGAIP